MLEAVIIGRGRSTPGWFSMRRRILRLRRFNWRWTLAFTRKPPGGDGSRGVNHLDCPLNPGGFRVSWVQRAWGYAWLRTNRWNKGVEAPRPARTNPEGQGRRRGRRDDM